MSKVRFGDVAVEALETCKNPEGLPNVGLEHLIPGDIALPQWSESSDNTFTKLFHKEQILFGATQSLFEEGSSSTV